jgi:hypothetical protein
MTTIFHSMDDIRKRLPDTARLIEDENKVQYYRCPDIKFIVGGIMSMSEDQDTQDLIAYFDVGNPKMVLWVWCSLGEERNLDDSFIDEYYEVSIEDATTNYCSSIYNEKKD